MLKVKVGDIVLVSNIETEDETEKENVAYHSFVIIDEETAVSAEFYGLIISSKINKSKNDSYFEFNEPVLKSPMNGLKHDSIVKCDHLFSIHGYNCIMKIGEADVPDFLRFIEAYNKYLEKSKK